jgi:hypothetical protein
MTIALVDRVQTAMLRLIQAERRHNLPNFEFTVHAKVPFRCAL